MVCHQTFLKLCEAQLKTPNQALQHLQPPASPSNLFVLLVAQKAGKSMIFR